MTIFRFRLVASALVAGVLSSEASANYLTELSRQEKWQGSDQVVIAQPLICSLAADPCEFRVVETLKGDKIDRFMLQRGSQIAEEAVMGCCDPGRLYLLYLIKGRDGQWRSVNGHWGVRELNPTAGK